MNLVKINNSSRDKARLVSIKNNKKPADQFLFYLYLSLWIWMPLPFGSNRIWAISIIEITLFLLSIYWLLLYIQGKVQFNKTFQSAKTPIILFLLFIAWSLIQSVPLPIEFLKVISPTAAQIHLDLAETFNLPLHYATISMSPYYSNGKTLLSFSYFLIFCLTLLLINSRQRLKLLAIIIIGCGLFQAVYGSLMTLSGVEHGFFIEKKFYRNVATGHFINSNHLAGYLELCLAMGIGLLLSTLHKTPAHHWREVLRRLIHTLLGSKIKLRIALVLMVIALVLTHSRMGNSAFFASFSIMGIIYLFLVKNPPRSVIYLFISLILIDVLIVGTWFGLEKIIEQIEQIEVIIQDIPQKSNNPLHKSIQIVNETRDEAYKDTRKIIMDFPLTGTGGGTYANIFIQYQSPPYYGFYDHVHNDYLEFLVEYGVIGLSLLMIIVILAFSNALITIKKHPSRLRKGIAFSSAMGIMAIMIHSTADFNLQIPANAALFVLFLALSWVVARR